MYKKDFTQIPNAICRTKRLSPQAIKLYIDIYSRCGKQKDGTPFYPWLSMEGIGKMIGIVKRTTIRRHIDELIQAKLIHTKSKQTNTGRPIQMYIPLEITQEVIDWLLSEEDEEEVGTLEEEEDDIWEKENKIMDMKSISLKEQLQKLKQIDYL
jgi:hypothetical protein